MEKAMLGARIAAETASSLAEIVSGINESNNLIIEIAESSAEQSSEIGHVNKGIDHVSQVVQQNSATAEQSAASAEEMSGQSVMLAQLASQFKTRKHLSGGDSYLPSPALLPPAGAADFRAKKGG